MWYYRTVLAAIEDAINALQAKGVSEPIIQFVHSLPDNQKGKAIGALNQNPSMMIDDLKNLFQSGYKPSSQELRLTADYDPRFRNWALHQYKLLRANKLNDDPKDDRWEYKQSISGYSGIKDDLDEIHDFFRAHVLDNPNYNIGTKSFQEAYDDSVEWHNAISQRGSGKFYLPFQRDESGNIVDEKIVHRFEDGSMVVRVEDPNDLDVEGNFMHHCVGSYASSVEAGHCTIYSLRNKFNNPEATIEVSKDGKVKQIKGPSNSSVKDEGQVEKIKEFFEGRDDIKKESGTKNPIADYFEDWEERIDWSENPEELGNNITYAIYGPDETEYDPYDYDDDESSEDFNRFGIKSPTWDHQLFADNNLYGADIPDLMQIAVNEIKSGISPDRNRYRLDSNDLTLEDYPIEDYVETFYTALVDKALYSLKQNLNRYDFERYLDVIRVLETATKKYKEAQEKYDEFKENYNSKEKMPSFMEWYEKQPEYMYFLLANKIENLFESSNFASAYKEQTGNSYKLPSGFQKNYWDKDDLEPFIKTQPIVDIYEKQKLNDISQLRLFAPYNETEEKDNQQIDKLTESPMTQKDENWAYAKVYNNKNFKLA